MGWHRAELVDVVDTWKYKLIGEVISTLRKFIHSRVQHFLIENWSVVYLLLSPIFLAGNVKSLQLSVHILLVCNMHQKVS